MNERASTSIQHAPCADGTEIAYEKTGSGPALVIVKGALCQRRMRAFKWLAPIH